MDNLQKNVEKTALDNKSESAEDVTRCNKNTDPEGVTRCNVTRCNSYTCYTSLKTCKQEYLKYEEVKDVYLKFRTEGLTPSVRAIREQLQRGSFATIQKFVNELNEEFAHNRLNEIQQKRVPDAVVSSLLNDLTERALKCTIKEDDAKIAALQNTILNMNGEHSKIDLENSELIDKYLREINELRGNLDDLEKSQEKLKKENTVLTNQITDLTNTIAIEKTKNKTYEEMMNLFKIVAKNPEIIGKIMEEKDGGVTGVTE